MAEDKAKVLLSYDVWRRIKWLTEKMDTEIAAVGKVQIKEDEETKLRYFYVDKLYFPKQEVTSVTVKIDPDGWGEILKDVKLSGMADLKFYWHRHPGSSSHSGTDEEDTFGTFMSNIADRDYFIFLQTAMSGGKMNHELRVELRKPIRATLVGDNVTQLLYYLPDETEFDEEMEGIVKSCIVEKPKPVYNQTTWWESKKESTSNSNELDSLKLRKEERNNGGFYMDNDTLLNLPTSEEEKVSLEAKDGGIIFKAGNLFSKVLEKALDEGTGKIKAIVKRWKKDGNENFHTYYLQPQAKGYKELIEASESLFLQYNYALTRRWEEKGFLKKEEEAKKEYPKSFTIERDSATLSEIINSLEKLVDITWNDDKVSGGIVSQKIGNIRRVIGNFTMAENCDKATFNGEGLVETVCEILMNVGGRDNGKS